MNMNVFENKQVRNQVRKSLAESGKEVSYNTKNGKTTFTVYPLYERWDDTKGNFYEIGEERKISISESDQHSTNFVIKAFNMGLSRFVFASPYWSDPVCAEIILDFGRDGIILARFMMNGIEHCPYMVASPKGDYGYEWINAED